MTKREWRQGDVALFRVERWDAATEWPDDTSRVLMRLEGDGRYWSAVEGDPAAPFTVHRDSPYLRPLVVIDPEDREAVERLYGFMWSVCDAADDAPAVGDPAHDHDIEDMQTALREFADPKPVIEEPTALYAVVKDRNGNKWCRVGEGVWRSLSSPGPYVVEKHWHDRDAPLNGNVAEILSEGQP